MKKIVSSNLNEYMHKKRYIIYGLGIGTYTLLIIGLTAIQDRNGMIGIC